jgi:hypothetical protein
VKQLSVCIILLLIVTFTLTAEKYDVVIQAQNDAVEDGQNYHPFWWGVGGVATTVLPFVALAIIGDAIPVDARRAVALAAPVFGGTSLTLIGYFTGKAEVPDARIAEIQNEYDDSSLIQLYESEYEKALTTIQRRKRGTYALIGFGVSVGVTGLGFLVAVLMK